MAEHSEEKSVVHLSARELAEFLLRSGSRLCLSDPLGQFGLAQLIQIILYLLCTVCNLRVDELHRGGKSLLLQIGLIIGLEKMDISFDFCHNLPPHSKYFW